MDPQVSTSFIPKKPLIPSRARASVSGFILLIAILVLVASLVGAGGVFAYERYLHTAKDSKMESLQLARAAYDAGVIESLVRLDTRMNEAQKILNTHIAPSTVFGFLSNYTLERVQLTSLSFDITEDGSAILEVTGIADSFSTLALQSDQFGGSDVLRDVIFSNIVIEPTSGKVTFAVHAEIPSAFLLYGPSLSRTAPAVLPPAPISTTTPEETPQPMP